MNTRKVALLATAIAAITVLTVVGGLASAYSVAERLANSASVGIINLASVDTVRGSPGTFNIRVAVTLNNTADTAVTLRDVKYVIHVNGVKVGEVEAGDTVVPAKSNLTQHVSVNVSGGEAEAVAKAVYRGTMNLEVTMEGRVPVTLYGVGEVSAVPIKSSKSASVSVGPYLGENLKNSVHVTVTGCNASSIPAASSSNAPVLGDVPSYSPVGVTHVYWYVNGEETYRAGKHDNVIAKVWFVKVKDVKGTVTLHIYVRRDIKWLPDTTLREVTYAINLSRAPKYFELTVTFTTESKHLLRGYFIDVSVDALCSDNGAVAPCEAQIYHMQSHYPPRLKVS